MRTNNFPAQLSGGEQKRFVIACGAYARTVDTELRLEQIYLLYNNGQGDIALFCCPVEAARVRNT